MITAQALTERVLQYFFYVESDNFRRILTGGLVGITVAVTVKFIARKIKFSR